MLAELKKSSIKKTIIGLLSLCVIAVIIFFVMGGKDVLQLIGGPAPLDVAHIEDYEGRYVSVTVDYSLGRYAYTTKKGQTTSHEFGIADYDGGYIYTLYMRNADYKKMAEWLPIDYAGVVEPRTITGTITKMSNSDQAYYDDMLEDYSVDPSWRAPYYLKVNNLGGQSFGSTVFFAAISFVLVAIGIYRLIRAITGGYQKKLLDYCKKTGSPEYTLSLIEQQYATAQKFGSLRLTPLYMMFQDGPTTKFFPINDILWVYQRLHKSYGVITTGRSLVLRFPNKSEAVVAMNQKTLEECREFIYANYPNIAVGYDGDLMRMYNQDPQSMVAYAAKQRQKTQEILAAAQPQAPVPQQATAEATATPPDDNLSQNQP
ncbi:hypothetical protein LJC61_00125 [Ruminococcaceae bacterium OttesenSCG-928-A16]|nr:hypothetical protein [Ruminococcaceae bacterium OttesenSCG-928-A16]